jgi:RNA polymerase sigma-70 factor (ECF subfamily)
MRRDDLGWAARGLLNDLFRYARWLERTEADAEDLTQECLARALDRADQLERKDALRVWIFRVMYRLHVDRSRAARRRGHLAVLKGGRDDLAAFSVGDLGEDIIAREDATLRHKGLSRLADDQRAAFVLVDVWGHTYEETAEIVGVPVGTVRSRLARARVRVEEELAAAHAHRATSHGSS